MLNKDRMIDETEIQIYKCKNEFQQYLFDYRTYVSKIVTGRGTASNRTITHHIKTISYFLRERNLNSFDNIDHDTIKQHLKRYKRQKNILSVIRRFSEFLYLEKKIWSKEKYENIIELKIKEIIAPGDSKKFAVPIERWNEVLNIEKIKKSFPKRFSVWLGLNFGLRLGEILHLTVSDLFLHEKASYLFIRKNKNIEYDDWEPKTASSTRRLYITEDQEEVIKKYLKLRENKKSIYLIYNSKTIDKNIPVIEDLHRRIFDNCYLDFFEHGQWVKRKLRFHVLRYSSAVYYYFQTRNIYAVSKMLGHSRISQTEEYLGLTEQQIFDEIKDMMTDAWKS
jgi:integrase